MIAKSYDEFIQAVTEATRTALNTEHGQKITRKLLVESLARDPDMTPEQWQEIRSQFLTFCILKYIRETPEAMEECAEHVYNMLRSQRV